MTFPLVCCSSGNTDAVKKILTYVQDPRNHRTTAQAGVFPIASERETCSVHRTHHVSGDIGSSAFRSDRSRLQRF